jgi:hypothetical protein
MKAGGGWRNQLRRLAKTTVSTAFGSEESLAGSGDLFSGSLHPASEEQLRAVDMGESSGSLWRLMTDQALGVGDMFEDQASAGSVRYRVMAALQESTQAGMAYIVAKEGGAL